MKRLWLRPTGRTVFHAIKHKVIKGKVTRRDYVIAECEQRIVMHDTKSPTIYIKDGSWSDIFPQCKRCLKALEKKESCG